jgi:HK97 family phage major capsid protein
MIDRKTIIEKRTERKTLCEQASELLKTAGDEPLEGEDLQKFEDMHARADTLKKQIDQLERQHDAEQDAMREALDLEDPERRDREVEAVERASETDAETADLHNEAWLTYMRGGDMAINAAKPEIREVWARAAWTTQADANGGYAVPTRVHEQVVIQSKQVNAVERAGAFVINEPMNGPYNVPTIDDSGVTGDMGGEGNAATADATPTFGNADLTDYRFDSDGIQVSRQMLNGSPVNLEMVIARLFGLRLGQAMQTKFTVGTGSSQPQGVVTGASVGKTAAAEDAITYDELLDLIHSCPQHIRALGSAGGVGFMGADMVLAMLRKLKDDNNMPIFVAGDATLNKPDTILGYPFTANDDVVAPEASAKSLVFGSFAAYWIKKVGQVRIYRDPFGLVSKEQVQFYAFWDAGGAVTDSTALKVLQMAAS